MPPHRRAKIIFHLCTERRGAIMALSGLVLVVMLGFVALTVDVGLLQLTKTQLQVAADGAALAAAGEVGYLGASNKDLESLVKEVSSTIAAAHLANGKSVSLLDTDTVLGKWDSKTASFTELSGSQLSSVNAVKVICACNTDHENSVKFFFAPILGVKDGNVSATAIARVKSSLCGLIIGLNGVTMSGSSYTDSYASEDGAYSAGSAGNGGHVCSNGNISMSGSSAINGNAHPGPGYTVKSSSSIGVTGSTEPLTQSISYPAVDPGDAATNNKNNTIPKSDDGKVPLSSGKFVLSGGDAVTLSPGTYYFASLSLSGGSTIRIVGPTKIYVTGSVAISGGSMANQTYLPKNLSLNVMGSKCDLSGSSAFYGTVYCPATDVVRSSTASFYGSMVGKTLTLSGSGAIHADTSLTSSNQGSSANSVLVQ